jgi:TorA maturation chaperone TorD
MQAPQPQLEHSDPPGWSEGLPPEEAGRARIYALLAHLFRAPPDEELLEAIADAGDVDVELPFIAEAWLELTCAAAWSDAPGVRAEYRRAFAGEHEAPLRRIAAACAALRDIILGRSLDLEAQARFFRRRVVPGQRACEALTEASGSRFYTELGRFASAFFRLERAAFSLPDHAQDRSLEQ